MYYLAANSFETNAYNTCSSVDVGNPWRWHSGVETGWSNKNLTIFYVSVNSIGLVKENKYINMYRLSNFKLGFS